MEWYYDYPSGQLHNGNGWSYDLGKDKLVNSGAKGETIDHITSLGQSTKEIDDGTASAFTASDAANQFNPKKVTRTFTMTHKLLSLPPSITVFTTI